MSEADIERHQSGQQFLSLDMLVNRLEENGDHLGQLEFEAIAAIIKGDADPSLLESLARGGRDQHDPAN